MTKEGGDGPIDGTMQLFGTFRIWLSIIGGIVVMLLAVGAFVISFVADRNFVSTQGTVEAVECGAPTKSTKCVRSKDQETCTTSTNVTCDVTVQYDAPPPSNKQMTHEFSRTYTEDHQPKKGDKLEIQVDQNDPRNVQFEVMSSGTRNMIRIGSVVVFVIALITVLINTIFRNNKNFKRMQGAIGTVDVISGAFSR